MEHRDFTIGTRFKCGGRTWQCTDLGTRTVAAICVGPASFMNGWFDGMPEEARREYWSAAAGAADVLDASWFKGPPYAVAEHVFDENDIKGCTQEGT